MSNYGKFSSNVDAAMYGLEYDEIVSKEAWGESWSLVWNNESLSHCVEKALLSQEDIEFLSRYNACIIHERSDGIVEVEYFRDRLEAEIEMHAVRQEYERYEDEDI